jgi:hypothetical protein
MLCRNVQPNLTTSIQANSEDYCAEDVTAMRFNYAQSLAFPLGQRCANG